MGVAALGIADAEQGQGRPPRRDKGRAAGTSSAAFSPRSCWALGAAVWDVKPRSRGPSRAGAPLRDVQQSFAFNKLDGLLHLVLISSQRRTEFDAAVQNCREQLPREGCSEVTVQGKILGLPRQHELVPPERRSNAGLAAFLGLGGFCIAGKACSNVYLPLLFSGFG